MTSLIAQYINETFGNLLQVSNSNSGIDGTLRAIEDGEGTVSKLKLSTDEVVIDEAPFYGHLAKINPQTGTTYTLDEADTGKVVTLNNAGSITVTLPNSLPQGFQCLAVQKGVGQVTFSAGSGAMLNNRQSHTKTTGQWAECSLYVDSNSDGSSAVYVLAGDTA